jgi:hypothetical protein
MRGDNKTLPWRGRVAPARARGGVISWDACSREKASSPLPLASAYALTRFGGLKPAVARRASEGGSLATSPLQGEVNGGEQTTSQGTGCAR